MNNNHIAKEKLHAVMTLLDEVEKLLENMADDDFNTYRQGQSNAIAALVRAENAVLEVLEEI